MTSVRVEDLPPEIRKQIAEGSVGGWNPPAARAAARRRPPREPSRYRCGGCGVEHVGYKAAETCAHAHHGARLELLR